MLRFAFGRKICFNIFFSSKANFKIVPKRLLLRRRALSPTVSEKLERYGSSALSGVEHLTLILGKEDLALALVRHFGSIKALSRASIQQLLQFLPRRKAETLVAALSMSTIAESGHARSEAFDGPESVCSACADLKLFNQEVLRVILLDARQRLITMIDVTKGSLNESLAYPRDIFRPVIVHSAYSFILAHNLWVATHKLCYVERGVIWSAPKNYRYVKRFIEVA